MLVALQRNEVSTWNLNCLCRTDTSAWEREGEGCATTSMS